MPRRTPRKIGQHIDLLRWVWWQTVRRTSRYQEDARVLLKCWEAASSEKAHEAVARRSVIEQCRRRGRFWAAKRAVEAYKHLSKTDSEKGESSKALAAELSQIADEGQYYRYYKLRNSRVEDGLPELKSFETQWGLRFPIPPSVGLPIEELMTGQLTQPVTIREGTRERLRLRLETAAGRGIVLAFVSGALGHCNPKRKRGTWMKGRTVSRKPNMNHHLQIIPTQAGQFELDISLPADKSKVCKFVRQHLPRSIASLRSREDYAEVFKVGDLLAAGATRRSIAEALKYPSAGSAIRVRDRERTFAALLRLFSLHE